MRRQDNICGGKVRSKKDMDKFLFYLCILCVLKNCILCALNYICSFLQDWKC